MASVTRRGTGNAARRAQVEARLLAATTRLLAGGAGFTELGVQRIAAAAGVARSSFYVHFPDKSALLVRLAEDLRQRSFELVARWNGEGPGGLEGLERLYERIVAHYRENAPLLAAIREAAAYDPAVRDSWQAQLDRFGAATAERLRRDRDDGLAPADLDVPAATTVIVVGGWAAIAEHIATHGGSGPASGDAALARELARIYWHGALRRPADAG